MRYTPGPWKSERGSGDFGRDITADNGRRIVAHTICSGHRENARLIAAAPELLTAAKGAVAALTQPKTYQADIDAAVKWLRDAIKATGE